MVSAKPLKKKRNRFSTSGDTNLFVHTYSFWATLVAHGTERVKRRRAVSIVSIDSVLNTQIKETFHFILVSQETVILYTVKPV